MVLVKKFQRTLKDLCENVPIQWRPLCTIVQWAQHSNIAIKYVAEACNVWSRLMLLSLLSEEWQALLQLTNHLLKCLIPVVTKQILMLPWAQLLLWYVHEWMYEEWMNEWTDEQMNGQKLYLDSIWSLDIQAGRRSAASCWKHCRMWVCCSRTAGRSSRPGTFTPQPTPESWRERRMRSRKKGIGQKSSKNLLPFYFWCFLFL